MDAWYKTGQLNQPSATSRLHSYADAIALIGVRSAINKISNYDTQRAVLRNGTTGVGVNASKVKVYNDSTTLNTLLQDLVTAIKGLSIDVAGIGPANGTVDATSLAALTSLATQIGGLLE